MAHLVIQFSPELSKNYNFDNLVNSLRTIMIKTGVFPVGGIRVRAWPTVYSSIADGNQKNKYVDILLRMGKGRSLEEKKNVGEEIISFCKIFFKQETEKDYFALSLEIIEIDAELSWKFNTIHNRLHKK